MGGGLMQLVAYGAQDIYLTGNPQITFFKVVYRRYTNFSMEYIQQTIDGSVNNGNLCSSTISRNGDLVYDCYVEYSSSDTGAENDGNRLIYEISVEIGGQQIDKQYGHFLETYAELSEKNYGRIASTSTASINIGASTGSLNAANISPYQLVAASGGSTATISQKHNKYVPLQFWSNKNPGLALPLIALQYHEVVFHIVFENESNLDLKSPTLWCNYIYLDTDERRRFAQVSHEYLIEQLQKQNFNIISPVSSVNNVYNFNLILNHPVKELIWAPFTTSTLTNSNQFSYAHDFYKDNGNNLNGDLATTIQLKLNGQDRFAPQNVDYFTRYQPMKYHTCIGRDNKSDTIAVYSFALRPEEHQPSGTCNFSRIDTAELVFTNLASTATSSTLVLYAINYNVLRIMSGMGGLAYSN